jgi:hypothetical protein
MDKVEKRFKQLKSYFILFRRRFSDDSLQRPRLQEGLLFNDSRGEADQDAEDDLRGGLLLHGHGGTHKGHTRKQIQSEFV